MESIVWLKKGRVKEGYVFVLACYMVGNKTQAHVDTFKNLRSYP